MPSTNLTGPFDLTIDAIDRAIRLTRPGAYALGSVDKSGSFHVYRVGRSDNDLNGRLKDYVGKYTSFKADYFESAKAAFEKECRLFHDFSPRDNDIHPDRPNGSSLTSPVCRALD